MTGAALPKPQPAGPPRDIVLISYSHTDRDWLERLQIMFVDTHRVYVHAGVDPARPLDAQAETTLLTKRYAPDDIIEQMRLRDYPYALAVQYHPERGTIYNALFDDFFSKLKS